MSWEYPVMFWLIAAAAAILLLPRRSRWFLRVATVAPLIRAKQKYQGRIGFKKYLPYFLLGGGLILLIIAAADPIAGEKRSRHRYLIHTYVIINDGSGSMTFDARAPATKGPRVESLLAANKAFLETIKTMPRPLDEKDAVGAVLFSGDAFILAYPDINYDNLWLKLNLINWKESPLGLGTELNKALWTAIQMIIRRNQQTGGEFFTAEELKNLQLHLSGSGRTLNLSSSLRKKAELIAEEIKGTSFIIFTDGQFYLEPYSYSGYSGPGGSGDSQLSAAKNILFCRQLGIRVYLIAAETLDTAVIPLVKKTGGQFQFLRKMEDVALLRKAYLNILQQQANEFVAEDEAVKVSYYFWPALAGLSLIFLGMLVKNTVSRSLTDSY